LRTRGQVLETLEEAPAEAGGIADTELLQEHLQVGDIADVLHVDADGEVWERNFSGTPLGRELQPRAGAGRRVNQRERSFIMLPVFGQVPEQKQLGTIQQNYHSGIPGIDALAPIGRGQNMLLVGKPLKGLCEATGILLHPGQKEENERHVKVIYAAVSDVARNAINSYNMDGFTEAFRDVYVVRPKEERVRRRIEQAKRERSRDAATLRSSVDDDAPDRFRRHRASFADIRHPIGGQNLIPQGFKSSEMYIDTFRESFMLKENSEGTRAEAVCVCHAALAVGEEFRSKGHEAIVIMDDLEVARSFWSDQETAMHRFLYPGASQESGAAPSRGTDDGEMRAFFSSLLHRVGKFNGDHGGGSLTCVALVHDQDIAGGDLAALEEGSRYQSAEALQDAASAKREYSLEDFSGDAYSNKVRERVSALSEKGISITDAVLKKIKVPTPSKPEALTENRKLIQSLISLSDGQIVINADMYQKGYYMPVDAKESLTRIGIGANINAMAMAPAVGAFTKGLRLALAQDFASAPAAVGAVATPEQRRVNAYRMLLFSPLPYLMGSFAVSRRLLVILFACAERGIFDDRGTRWVQAKTREDAQMDERGAYDGDAIQKALWDFSCPLVDAAYNKEWRSTSLGTALEAAAIARCAVGALALSPLAFEDGGDFLSPADAAGLREEVNRWLADDGPKGYRRRLGHLEEAWSTVTPERRGPGGRPYNALGEELSEDMFEGEEHT